MSIFLLNGVVSAGTGRNTKNISFIRKNLKDGNKTLNLSKHFTHLPSRIYNIAQSDPITSTYLNK